MSFLKISSPAAARRLFLERSGAVLALLAGREALAAKSGDSKAGDARILNTALAAELEAVAAYQVGAESNLLQKPALDLALQFQGHHKAHADLGAVPLFATRDLSKAAASILGDEAMHWAVLRQVIGENPVPAAFVS